MRVLTVNGGSSSVKFALFERVGDRLKRPVEGKVDHIGLSSAYMSLRVGEREWPREHTQARTYQEAIDAFFSWFRTHVDVSNIDAVAHRVVHGAHFKTHTVVTPAVLAELRRMVPYDPEHMPAEIALIEAATELLPLKPHIACFDTVFHQSMPYINTLIPLPREYRERGLRRYGFHGLSYASVLKRFQTLAPTLRDSKIIIAHLGNGASLTALAHGVSVDTTMAFSPNSGVMMGTRSGDIDPGILRYLTSEGKKSPEEVDALLSKKSGLLGISGSTYDMYALLQQEATDTNAHDAIELFCHIVRKQIGALATSLGGIDTLIFTGGMGAASAPIRSRILRGLEFLNVHLDDALNATREGCISPLGEAVSVWVIPTDEEVEMAEIAQSIIHT